ncbi:hypothetical protein BB560_004457, partial [Smittium megazygosporum]
MKYYKQSVVIEYVEFTFQLLLLDPKTSAKVLNGDEIGQIIYARIPEDKNLSEMVNKIMIHSHGIAYNRDPSVCKKHFPTPVSNRTCHINIELVSNVNLIIFRKNLRFPSVTGLPIYLKNQKQVIFNKVDEIQQALGVSLITVDGHTFGSYQEADIFRGLLVSDNEWMLCFQEAINEGSVAQIYKLYNQEMQQDFIEQGMDNKQSTVALLQELQSRFILMRATLSQFGLPDVPMIRNLELEIDVGEYRSFVEANSASLNNKQRSFFSAHMRLSGKVALVCVSTELAATLYKNGFNAHTLFGIPVRESGPEVYVSTCSNVNKGDLDAADRLLKKVNGTELEFGEKIISNLWSGIQTWKLKVPQRFLSDPDFSTLLDSIGDGSTTINNIVVLSGFKHTYSVAEAIKHCFSELNDSELCSSASI